MKRITSLLVLALCAAVLAFGSESYTLNNAQVDQMFDQAVEVNLTNVDASGLNVTAPYAISSTTMSTTGKVAVAIIVNWVGFGAFGIHRYVLGTKGSMWAIYTFTVCGIFGIVPFVDFWVLIIDGLILGNGDKYIDNEKFFMWF